METNSDQILPKNEPTKTPYNSIPFDEVPERIHNLWRKYQDKEVPENRLTNSKYELRIWGFVTTIRLQKPETIVKRRETFKTTRVPKSSLRKTKIQTT